MRYKIPLVIGLFIFAYGVFCVVTESVMLPTKHRGLVEVTGKDSFWLALGIRSFSMGFLFWSLFLYLPLLNINKAKSNHLDNIIKFLSDCNFQTGIIQIFICLSFLIPIYALVFKYL